MAVESAPSGAQASFSGGVVCQTPCSLPAPGANGTYYVSVSLDGYERRSIPVRVSTGREHWYSDETTSVDPNPVLARLEPLAPPKKESKKPGPKPAPKVDARRAQ